MYPRLHPCQLSSLLTSRCIKVGPFSSVTSPLPFDKRALNGVCAVHKPIGITSSDCVTAIKRSLVLKGLESTKREVNIKVGHGGTLDPLAEGVLVLGIGEGTKLLQSYLSGSKAYKAVASIGKATDTLDCTGKVVEEKDGSFVTRALIDEHLNSFRGDIQQTPPMYSALKFDGERLYDLARRGVEVERKARNVTVYNLTQLIDSVHQPPTHFALDVECGGGFYIRSLIADLAEKMGTVAHMTELVRTKQVCPCLFFFFSCSLEVKIPHVSIQGIFTLQDCIPADKAVWTYENILSNLQHCQHKLQQQGTTVQSRSTKVSSATPSVASKKRQPTLR